MNISESKQYRWSKTKKKNGGFWKGETCNPFVVGFMGNEGKAIHKTRLGFSFIASHCTKKRIVKRGEKESQEMAALGKIFHYWCKLG